MTPLGSKSKYNEWSIISSLSQVPHKIISSLLSLDCLLVIKSYSFLPSNSASPQTISGKISNLTKPTYPVCAWTVKHARNVMQTCSTVFIHLPSQMMTSFLLLFPQIPPFHHSLWVMILFCFRVNRRQQWKLTVFHICLLRRFQSIYA